MKSQPLHFSVGCFVFTLADGAPIGMAYSGVFPKLRCHTLPNPPTASGRGVAAATVKEAMSWGVAHGQGIVERGEGRYSLAYAAPPLPELCTTAAANACQTVAKPLSQNSLAPTSPKQGGGFIRPQQAAQADSHWRAAFARTEALAAALRRDLERCATIHAIMARKLAARRGVGRRAPVVNPATIQ